MAWETQIEIRAFGERIAYKTSGAYPRSAGVALPFGLPPEALELLGGLAFLGLLAWLAKHGALVLVIQRPAYAGVSAVLVVVLVLGPVPGVPVSKAGGGGGASFYFELADPLGTGMLMLDETGARRVHRTYSPFGVEQASAGPASWLPRHYAGHLKDEEPGLVYMEARWMDPESGTFLSVDPVVGNAFDPQSHNAYSYARNNPASFTDPTGAFAYEWWSPPPLDVPAFGNNPGASFSMLVVLAATSPPLNFTEPQSPLGVVEGVDRSQGGTGNPVVNSTFEALQHYFRGNGEPAELGPDVQDAIINSRDQQYRYDRIRTGRTPNLDRGVYGVDVELDGAYFVGDTPIEYKTLCRSGSCTTTFTSRGDGFWDVVRDVDRGGPRGELPGGTPYPFLPFSWQQTFPDPRSTRP